MYPWEQKPLNYVQFMDTHIRVSVFINGELRGTFAILDQGNITETVETIMPDGIPLRFKVEGHPRTTDTRMTVEELVSYVLANYR